MKQRPPKNLLDRKIFVRPLLLSMIKFSIALAGLIIVVRINLLMHEFIWQLVRLALVLAMGVISYITGIPFLINVWLFATWGWGRDRVAYSCPKCGHDICATPHHCPKCGSPLVWGMVPPEGADNQKPSGLCNKCGYTFGAFKAGDRCPGCGALILLPDGGHK
jgi:hypothetical protein